MPEYGATIGHDTPCTRCGYNLRGLTTDMACPECSTPVGSSIHGDLLAFADPEWLDTLRRGTSLKLWAMLLGVVGGVFVATVVEVLGGSEQLAMIPILPGVILGLWAVFLITTQEPRISLREDAVTLRKAVRFCAVIGCLEEPTKAVWEPLTGEAQTVALVVLIVATCLEVMATFGEFVYYRRFARRIPDEALVRSTTIVMWGTAVCMVVLLIGLAMGLAFVGTAILTGGAPATGASRSGLPGMLFFFCAGGLGIMIFAIWNIVLLFRYRRAFGAAAEAARSASVTDQGGGASR